MHVLQTTVGRLVAQRPERAQVFEEFDIDYCCGGKRTLGEACARRGVDPAMVVRQLEKVDADEPEASPDWMNEPLPALCDHIVATHHQFLRQELPRLHGLLSKIARVHGEHHPELLQLLDVFEPFSWDLDLHMDKEEQVLFPLVKRLVANEVPASFYMLAPLRVMETEHDQAGLALAEMRELTNNYELPGDACGSYRAAFAGLQNLEQDLHRHVHLENNVLFPRMGQLIAAERGVNR
jgi:regulator of cell morphogenesis and NO signaling